MSTQNDVPIGLSIARDTLMDFVRGEIVRSLGNQEEMIRAVVRASLDATDPRSVYDKKPIFQKQVESMIREVAHEIAREWIAAKREDIKAAFKKAIESESSIDKLVNGMIGSLANYNISVKFDWAKD